MFHEFIYEFGCTKVPDDAGSSEMEGFTNFSILCSEILAAMRIDYNMIRFKLCPLVSLREFPT